MIWKLRNDEKGMLKNFRRVFLALRTILMKKEKQLRFFLLGYEEMFKRNVVCVALIVWCIKLRTKL